MSKTRMNLVMVGNQVPVLWLGFFAMWRRREQGVPVAEGTVTGTPEMVSTGR